MSDPSLVAAQSAVQKNAPAQMTLEQFGKKIKAAHPDTDYAAIPDAELAKKMLAVYPQYHSVVKGEKLNQPQKITAKMPSASQQEVHNNAEYLPAVGATIGGVVGSGAMSIPAAALGGAAGEAAKQLANRAAGEGAPDTSKGAAKDVGKSGAMYGALEGGSIAALKGAGWIYKAVKDAGAPLGSKAASLAITKAVNPVIREWPEFTTAVREQVGNITEYAQKNGIKIESQRDFAAAAKGAAEESNKVFKEQYIDPVAKQEVSVNPNYRGHTTDPHRATVGDIYARILKINDELRPSYMQTEQGIVQSRLANEGDLLAEKASLTKQLEGAIHSGTGAKPEAIATIRRRTAQLFSIADYTEAAANVRSSSAGKMNEGRSLATTKSGWIDRLIEWSRGGREKIADRTLTKTLKRTQIPSTDIPIPPGAAEDAGAAGREASRTGRASERASVPLQISEAIKTDDKEVAELQRSLAQRITKNNAAKESAKTATEGRATMRAGRIAERQSVTVQQGTTKTTEESAIDELRANLAARIKRNQEAKKAAQALAERNMASHGK